MEKLWESSPLEERQSTKVENKISQSKKAPAVNDEII
jgi:hypothetical protein